MFCSKCGSKLAEGARFCSECGAKVADEATGILQEAAPSVGEDIGGSGVGRRSSAFGLDTGYEEAQEHSKRKSSGVSFDWSSVTEESHRKPILDIKSPWDSSEEDESTGAAGGGFTVPEREESIADRITEDAGEGEPGRSRTMNFIEMMQQEKAARDQAADAAPSAEKPSFDYSETILPERERVNTQGYTDLKKDIVGEMERPQRETEPEEPLHTMDFDEQLAYIRARSSSAQGEPDPATRAAADAVPAQPSSPEEPAELRQAGDETINAYLDYMPPSRTERSQAREAREEIAGTAADFHVAGEEMPEQLGAAAFEIADSDEPAEDNREEDAYLGSHEDYDAYDDKEDDYAIYYEEMSSPEAEYYDEDEEEEETFIFGSEEESGEDLAPEETDAAAEPAGESAQAAVPETTEQEIESLRKRLAELLGEEQEEAEELPPREAAAEEAPVQEEAPAVTAPEATAAISEAVQEAAAPEALETAPEAVQESAAPEAAEAASPAETAETIAVADQPADVAADQDEDAAADSIDAELAALGLDRSAEPENADESDMLFTAETTDVSSAAAPAADEEADEPADDAMSIEDLQKELFGTEVEDEELEATRKIDKFYTLYKKNEEFQRLLDEEYAKLQGGEESTEVEDALAAYEASRNAAEEKPAAEEAPAGGEATGDQVAEAVEREAQKLGEESAEAAAAVAAEPTQEVRAAEQPAAAAETPMPEAVREAAAPELVDEPGEEKAEEKDVKGTVLTVIAVVAAVLLVLLLIVILILNFMPDSAMATRISETIDNFANFASAGDALKLLL